MGAILIEFIRDKKKKNTKKYNDGNKRSGQ